VEPGGRGHPHERREREDARAENEGGESPAAVLEMGSADEVLHVDPLGKRRASQNGLAVTGLTIAIFGPTASGKTAVAEALAKGTPGELVSADAMQVDKGLAVLADQSPHSTRLVCHWPPAR